MDEEQKISEKEKEALKFLERDFNQCFIQMRHYDAQLFDTLKFLFSGYIGLIGFALGLYQFGVKERIDLSMPGIVVLAVGILLGLFMFSVAVRNRVYFVHVARYVNEQRKFFTDIKPLGFKNESKMYTNSKYPQYFNWRSSHSWLLYIIAFLNCFLLGIMFFIIFRGLTGYTALVILGGPAVLYAVQLFAAYKYLGSRNMKTAERSVFGKE